MISIIIPTYNRLSIFECLESIYAQKNAPDFEVIVVAREPTEYICHEMAARFPQVNFCIYNLPGNGPAKNAAVKLAKGDFLAFTDDDIVVGKNWLEGLMEFQKIANYDIVAGPVFPFDFTCKYQVAHQGHILYHLEKNPKIYINTHEYKKATCGTTMNLLVRKAVFTKLGGFDPSFATHYGDDFDFNMRWSADNSITASYSPHAIVKHNHRLTFNKLVKLSFRMGIGHEHCHKLHEQRFMAKVTEIIGTPPDSVTLGEDFTYMPRSEYKNMVEFFKWHNTLQGCSIRLLKKAARLAILMQEVKRLGGWWARRHPEVPSKIYD